MKKVILIIAVLMTSLASNSQSTSQNTPRNNKVEYSFIWGIFKSKDYPKDTATAFEFEKPEYSNSPSNTSLDTIKYEQKSVLWGAVQWTEKKKNVTPIKN
jgi:hypothetical protein